MSKANRTKRQTSKGGITHLVQARITRTREKHVCQTCGDDAYLLDIGYEAITQNQLNQMYQEVRRGYTMDEQWEAARTSSVSEAIYQATLREQQNGLPCEHARQYRCFSCMSSLLTKGTGIPGGGEAVLSRLLAGSVSHAIFVLRNVLEPDRMLLLNAPFQDVESVRRALRFEQDITRLQVTSIAPDEGA